MEQFNRYVKVRSVIKATVWADLIIRARILHRNLVPYHLHLNLLSFARGNHLSSIMETRRNWKPSVASKLTTKHKLIRYFWIVCSLDFCVYRSSDLCHLKRPLPHSTRSNPLSPTYSFRRPTNDCCLRAAQPLPDGLWRLMRFEIEEKWSGTIGGLRNQVARGRHCVLLLNGVTTVIQFPQ